jgi:hypothetical protein
VLAIDLHHQDKYTAKDHKTQKQAFHTMLDSLQQHDPARLLRVPAGKPNPAFSDDISSDRYLHLQNYLTQRSTRWN